MIKKVIHIRYVAKNVGLKEVYKEIKEIEKYGINIIDKKEFRNVKKQLIIEAL